MRIVMINEADAQDGASRATLRLHRALRGIGVDSWLLVRGRHTDDPHVVAVDAAIDSRRPELDARCRDQIERQLYRKRRTALSNTLMTFPYPGLDLGGHPLVQSADVIHCHWVSRMLSPITLARLIGRDRPLVWTLRDQNPFTGGCHYSAGCLGYETECGHCPQLLDQELELPKRVLADKQAMLRDADLTIVALSSWLAGCARRSALMRERRIEVIPNALDPDVFYARSQQACRRVLGIADGATLILVGAQVTDERRKGVDLLFAALRRLRPADLEGPLVLACFGRAEAVPDDLPVAVLRQGVVDDDTRLATLYGAADLTVVPSREDNYPNVALESLACGVPVVGFRQGGLPDLVEDDRFGLLADATDADALARALTEALRRRTAWRGRRAELAALVQLRNGPERIAKRYEGLFAELIASDRRPRPAPPTAAAPAVACPINYRVGPGLGPDGRIDPALLRAIDQATGHREPSRSSGASVVFAVMPVFNRARETLRCLELLARQTHGPIVPVVVDGGSSDGTLDQVLRAFPEARVRRAERPVWWAGAVALGITEALAQSASSHDFVLLLNDDADFGTEFVATLVAAARRHRAVISSVVFERTAPSRITFAGATIDWPRYRFQPRRTLEPGTDVGTGNHVLPGFGTLVPIAMLRAVGNVRADRYPHHLADYDLTARLRAAGFRLVVCHAAELRADITNLDPVGGIVSLRRAWRMAFARRSRANLLDHLHFVADHAPPASKWRLRLRLIGRAMRPIVLDSPEIDALANRYRYGRGVVKNPRRALRHYRIAAGLGNDNAMSNLGTMYLSGEGVPRDLARALHWLERASARGNRFAPYHLARLYRDGADGIAADRDRATRWYRLAGERGHPHAESELTRLQAEQTAAPGAVPAPVLADAKAGWRPLP